LSYANNLPGVSVGDFSPYDTRIPIFVRNEAFRLKFVSFRAFVTGPAGIDEAVGTNCFEHEGGKLGEVVVVGDERMFERGCGLFRVHDFWEEW
jgi:hypothetical protein